MARQIEKKKGHQNLEDIGRAGRKHREGEEKARDRLGEEDNSADYLPKGNKID